jgi:hypothetical protein
MNLDNMVRLWAHDLMLSSVRYTIIPIITKLSAEGSLAPHIKKAGQELN